MEHNSKKFIPAFSYDGTLGHNYGSDTSENHMIEEMENANTKQAAILSLFLKAGTEGLVSSEAEDLTGWKHQTVSSHIRNMELAGVLCKTDVIRIKQHVYIHSSFRNEEDAPRVVAPTPQRSWKTNYDKLVEELTAETTAAIFEGDGYIDARVILNIIKRQ